MYNFVVWLKSFLSLVAEFANFRALLYCTEVSEEPRYKTIFIIKYLYKVKRTQLKLRLEFLFIILGVLNVYFIGYFI